MTKINQNDKKQNNKRKLLLLILLLMLTLTGLGASTMAWFTSNKNVNVDDINVDVRAVNGLEISADAINWGVKIDKDDLITGYTGHTNQLPDSLGAVSSVKNLTAGNLLQLFDGSVATNCADGGTDCDDPTYTLTAVEASEKRCYDSDSKGDANASAVEKCSSAGKRLMAFDIFLKVDKDNTNLYITENAGVANTSVDDLGIKNTSRVAFVVQGNVPSVNYRNDEDGIEQAQLLLNGEQVVLWEPNYDAHTQSGVNAANAFYGITGLTPGNGNSLQAYEGVSTAITTPVLLTETNSTKHPESFAGVVPDITSPATGAVRQSTKITLMNGVTKLRVYFWVEGQDVDTENDATGSNMKLNLEFSID